MSESNVCSNCGKTYGASWGDTTNLCSRCKINPNWEKDLETEREKLKEEVQQLKKENQELIRELAILKKETPPNTDISI